MQFPVEISYLTYNPDRMSDDERSQGSSPYTSEADEDDLEEYVDAEAEAEAEPDEAEVQAEGDAEGEADPADEEDDEDEDDSDEESEEEEEEDDQDDAEGDDDDEDAGDLEAALENMEAMDEEPIEAEVAKRRTSHHYNVGVNIDYVFVGLQCQSQSSRTLNQRPPLNNGVGSLSPTRPIQGLTPSTPYAPSHTPSQHIPSRAHYACPTF